MIAALKDEMRSIASVFNDFCNYHDAYEHARDNKLIPADTPDEKLEEMALVNITYASEHIKELFAHVKARVEAVEAEKKANAPKRRVRGND